MKRCFNATYSRSATEVSKFHSHSYDMCTHSQDAGTVRLRHNLSRVATNPNVVSLVSSHDECKKEHFELMFIKNIHTATSTDDLCATDSPPAPQFLLQTPVAHCSKSLHMCLSSATSFFDTARVCDNTILAPVSKCIKKTAA